MLGFSSPVPGRSMEGAAHQDAQPVAALLDTVRVEEKECGKEEFGGDAVAESKPRGGFLRPLGWYQPTPASDLLWGSSNWGQER